MLNKTDDVVLEIQNILMKTYKGRNISDKAKEAVSSWKKMAGSEYGKKECLVCGLILSSNYFIHGCINCGSTDIESL